jgi:hypothetical protein
MAGRYIRTASQALATGDGNGTPATWNDNSGRRPFVLFAGNRAACATCVMDFAEAPRVRGSQLLRPRAPDAGSSAGSSRAAGCRYTRGGRRR